MSRHPLAERALSASAVLNGCSLEALRGDRRTRGIARARHVAMIALQQCGLNQNQIAKAMERDRSSVRYALSKTQWSGGVGAALTKDAKTIAAGLIDRQAVSTQAKEI